MGAIYKDITLLMIDDFSLCRTPRQPTNSLEREEQAILKRRERSAYNLFRDFESEKNLSGSTEFPPMVLGLEVFQFCTHWIETKRLFYEITNECLLHYKNNTAALKQRTGELILEAQRNLIGLWFVAEFWGFPTLQNLVVDRIVEIHEYSPDILQQVIRPLVENTVQGSPLRRLYVDICARDLAMKAVTEYPENYPKVFMAETMVAIEQLFEESDGRDESLASSNYHVGLENDHPW